MSYDILGLRNDGKNWRIPNYQAVHISSSGSISHRVDLLADGDAEALCLAQALAVGTTIELWDGRRFIKHFRASA